MLRHVEEGVLTHCGANVDTHADSLDVDMIVVSGGLVGASTAWTLNLDGVLTGRLSGW